MLQVLSTLGMCPAQSGYASVDTNKLRISITAAEPTVRCVIARVFGFLLSRRSNGGSVSSSCVENNPTAGSEA